MYQQIMAFNPPTSANSCTGLGADFARGACAITFNYDYNFKMYNGSLTYGQPVVSADMGVDFAPGSSVVWDGNPNSVTLVPCTASSCPLGEPLNSLPPPPPLASPPLPSPNLTAPGGKRRLQLQEQDRNVYGSEDQAEAPRRLSQQSATRVNRPIFSSFAIPTESIDLSLDYTTPEQANAAVSFSSYFDNMALKFLTARQQAINPAVAAIANGTSLASATALINTAAFVQWNYSSSTVVDYLSTYLRFYVGSAPSPSGSYSGNNAVDVAIENAMFYR